MNKKAYNELIFRPQGGGEKVNKFTLINRTRLYITRKLKVTPSTIDQEDAEVICCTLKEIFNFSVADIVNHFGWSRTSVFRHVSNGGWKRKTLKETAVFNRKVKDFIDYLLYNSKFY